MNKKQKYYPLFPGERASLKWEIDPKTKGPTLWVKEIIIKEGKKRHVWHWVLDGSLFKEGSLNNEKDHVQVFIDSAFSYPGSSPWNIIAAYDKKTSSVKIVRKTKEIKEI